MNKIKFYKSLVSSHFVFALVFPDNNFIHVKSNFVYIMQAPKFCSFKIFTIHKNHKKIYLATAIWSYNGTVYSKTSRG